MTRRDPAKERYRVGPRDPRKASQTAACREAVCAYAFTQHSRMFQSVTCHSLVNAHRLFSSLKSHCKFLEQQQPQFVSEIKGEHKRKDTRKMVCIEHSLTSAKATAALCSGQGGGVTEHGGLNWQLSVISY